MYFSGIKHISISMVFQKGTIPPFTGYGTQHMSQKVGCSAKNGTVGKYGIKANRSQFRYKVRYNGNWLELRRIGCFIFL